MSNSIKMDLDVSELEQALGATLAELGAYAGDIVDTALETIKTNSVNQVPVDTGTLQSTAFTESERTSDGASGIVGYNGEAMNPKSRVAAAEYMVKVHEDLNVTHPSGKAKFLEDPVNEYTDMMEEDMGIKLNAAFTSIYRG